MSRTTLDISEEKALKITYGAFAVLFAVIFGGAAWMTSIELHSAGTTEQIVKIKEEQENVQSVLIQIDKRLLRIEILLEKIATK